MTFRLLNAFRGLQDPQQTPATFLAAPPISMRDLAGGRLKVSEIQNIYEADFEYGAQPLRWEAFTAGSGSITHLPGAGGVRMRLTTAAGDVTIRQSRPYHRYQPGKTMAMASAVLFGAALSGQRQRVGFFDDGNGIFFEQGDPTTTNPAGMFCVYRSDVNGVPVDTRISCENWMDPDGARDFINWTRIQMVFIEYAWYGAGALRWGVMIDGQPRILHQVSIGNLQNQTVPWARTGNLPVRYEQRNLTSQSGNNDMLHWGVSVLVDGRADDQRGFTYSYGMALQAARRAVSQNVTRFPVLSIRNRVMGTIEATQAGGAIQSGATTTSMTVAGTPWTVGQWVGRCVHFPTSGEIGRITANTTNTLTYQHNITGAALGAAPGAGVNYTIGLVNRGQILPRQLILSSDALAQIELIASTASSPVSLTSASFTAMSTLGSANSFAERDVSATALSGGEVVMAFTAPAGGSGLLQFDLTNLFPLYNTVRGSAPDILTVAVTTPSGAGANVGANLVCQEAMS